MRCRVGVGLVIGMLLLGAQVSAGGGGGDECGSFPMCSEGSCPKGEVCVTNKDRCECQPEGDGCGPFPMCSYGSCPQGEVCVTVENKCDCQPEMDPETIVGDCGVVRLGETGCSDSVCEACVCGGDPFCCGAVIKMNAPSAGGGAGEIVEAYWDGICVSEAAGLFQEGVNCASACLITRRAAPALSPAGMAACIFLLLGIGLYGYRRRLAQAG